LRVQTDHPSPSAREFRLLLNGLAASALRRMFCSDEGACVRGMEPKAATRETGGLVHVNGPFRPRQLAPSRPDNSTRLSEGSRRHYPDEIFGTYRVLASFNPLWPLLNQLVARFSSTDKKATVVKSCFYTVAEMPDVDLSFSRIAIRPDSRSALHKKAPVTACRSSGLSTPAIRLREPMSFIA
jgi:hypothetical protein